MEIIERKGEQRVHIRRGNTLYRLRAGAIPYRLTEDGKNYEILVITSTKQPSKYIIPAGTTKPEEINEPQNTAIREVEEEAGVRGVLEHWIGEFVIEPVLEKGDETQQNLNQDIQNNNNNNDKNTTNINNNTNNNSNNAISQNAEIQKTIAGESIGTITNMYVLLYTQDVSHWMEKERRQKKWLNVDEAEKMLNWRERNRIIFEAFLKKMGRHP